MQTVYRERGVHILEKARAIKIGRYMAHHQRIGIGIVGNDPVIARAGDKRRILAAVQTGCADDSHPALRKRPSGNPGRLLVIRELLIDQSVAQMIR